jgi:YbbR domain-containing protein
MSNLPLKLASLLIALSLAYVVQSASNSSTISIFVPLEVKNIPEDRAIVKPIRRGTQITLRGPSFLVGSLAANPPQLKVKLPDSSSDRVTVSLRSLDLDLPHGIELVNMEPSQIEFEFEPLERQLVRVEVPRVGELKKGLLLSNLEIFPKTLQIRGERSDLKAIKTVESEPLDLSSLRESTEVTLNIRPLGGSIVSGTKSVAVRVSISEQPSERSFQNVPVELRVVGGITEPVIVQPGMVNVTISGAPNVISELSASELSPYIRQQDLEISAGAPADRAVLKQHVQIQLPEGLKVVKIDPQTVVLSPLTKSDSRGDKLSRTRR